MNVIETSDHHNFHFGIFCIANHHLIITKIRRFDATSRYVHFIDKCENQSNYDYVKL